MNRRSPLLLLTIVLLLAGGDRAHCEKAQALDLYSNFNSSLIDAGRERMHYDGGEALDSRFTSTEGEVIAFLRIDLPDHRKLKIAVPISDFHFDEADALFPSNQTLPSYSGRMLTLLNARSVQMKIHNSPNAATSGSVHMTCEIPQRMESRSNALRVLLP